MRNTKRVIALILLLSTFVGKAQKGTVLFFIAQDSTYYSEYIVAYEALAAAGYNVDVRSATSNPVKSYMIPAGTTINGTANTLVNSSYSDFTQQFLDLYGKSWDSNLNSIPANIPIDGSILSVADMTNYVALVLAGGTGIQNYRIDGSHSAQSGATGIEVQQAAEKLNALAVNALQNEKPVLAQCHGASLPVYWRVPGTVGVGNELLGFSLLKGEKAAGYPSAQTSSLYSDLGVERLVDNKVMVSSPHSSFNSTNGNFKIITSADWYPQTILFATQTLINIIETYPSKLNRNKSTSVLIIHGGAIDENNCSAGNKANDVPCNYGVGSNLPADFTHLKTLLESNSSDEYNMQVTDLNLNGTLPFNSSVQSEVFNYLSSFGAVVFFKHWSTSMTDEIQYAIKDYADNGGGVIALHHGMYNDVHAGQNIDILVNEVFGMTSQQNTWSAGLNSFSAVNTNYGHFINSFSVIQDTVVTTPSSWSSVNTLKGSNLSFSFYPRISMYDEVYNNMSFTGIPVFGSGENEITPLFSNTSNPNSQIHTTGFAKLFSATNNGKVGKIVCLAQGERRESIDINHPYGQIIRNAVIWSATESGTITNSNFPNEISTSIAGVTCFPNPATAVFNVRVSKELFPDGVDCYSLFDLTGKLLEFKNTNKENNFTINTSLLNRGVYLLSLKINGKTEVVRFVK